MCSPSRPRPRRRAGPLLALVLIGALLVPVAAPGQPTAHRRYTANSGLPTNLTKAVAQDGSGRLWIGTDNGLVRFNGSTFETYREALRSPLVKDVYPTPDRGLLVVTDRGIQRLTQQHDSVSLSLMVAGRETRTDSTVKYPKTVYQDRHERLWIAEWDALVRYEDGTLTRYVLDSTRSTWSDRFMRSFLFAEPSGGPLVAAAQRGSVFAFDAPADRFRPLSLPNRPEDFHVNALIPNPEGPGLLLGTNDGLYRLVVEAPHRVRRWEKLNDLSAISSLCPGPDGGLLIGTWEKGLYRASALDAEPVPYGDLPFVVIQDIITTKDDAIVLATDTGLGVIPHSFFRSVLPPTEKGNRYIRNVALGPAGQVWVSRNEDIFSVVRAGATFQARPYSFLDREGDVWGLSPTAEGVWMGFQDGHLEYVEDGRRRRVALPPSDPPLVRSIVPDGEGGVWVLKDGLDGAVHVTASFETTHYGRGRDGPGRLLALHRTAADTLYAGGTGTDGYLYRFAPTRNRFVAVDARLPDAVSAPLRIQDLADGPAGALWLASSQGLLRYRAGRLAAVDVLAPYDVESVSAVAVTDERRVWLGTNQGLFAYAPATGSLRRFGQQTGLPSSTILPRCLRLDDEGRLWVGTAQGLAYLHDPPLRPARTPKPVVTKLWADNRIFRARPDSVLRLAHNATVEIRYAAPVFVQDGTVYRHRIRDEGAEWSPVSTGSPLVLHELSGGTYTLELTAQQPGFGWSAPTRVHFSVQPPWYLRWWALLLGGAFLAGLLGLLGLLYRHRRAQRKAERALYRSRKQYESVVENVEEGIFQLDRDGRWTFLNPAWSAITGYAVDDSLGRPYDAFVHPDDRETLADTVEPLLRGEQERGRCQVRFEEPDGSLHWVEVRAQLLREEDGSIAGLTGLLVDVHERKQYEAQLIEAKERAEEMNRLKTVFLANMGHELRTPLTSILGFARSLREELPNSYRDLIQPIQSSGQRLKRTFDSVLSLAQIEGDALHLDRKPEEVTDLVDETLSYFRDQADQENVALRLEAPTAPVHAQLDARAFERILSNLLSNALKFTEEGHVLVRVESTGPDVVVTVADTGVGISADFLPKVFEEFQQESEGRTRNYEGSGLGLTIAKRLVERMDGTIDVDSEKGVGTTVTLRFPTVETPVASRQA